MPKLPSVLEQCETWLRSNQCPSTDPAEPRIAHWIFRAARTFSRRRLSEEIARTFIETAVQDPSRQREIEREIANAYGNGPGTFVPPPQQREPKPEYDPSKLEALANRIDFDVAPEWLEGRSPLTGWNRTPAGFLQALYEPGEKIIVFDVFKSQGCDVWAHPGRTGNLASLNYLQKDRFGAWFLAAPVTGEWIELDRLKSEHNPTGRTRRAEENVTAFRYAVIESDRAPKDLWLRALVQLPLPIASITDSGDCSIHALIRVDASDKNEWDRIVRRDLAPLIVPIGADIGAMTAVRLTRLPNCWRGQTGRLQQLLYLDPEPDGEPIIESLPREAPGSAQGRWESALEVTQ